MQRHLSKTLSGLFLVIVATQLAPAQSLYLVEVIDGQPEQLNPDYTAILEPEMYVTEEPKITRHTETPLEDRKIPSLVAIALNGTMKNTTIEIEEGQRAVFTCKVDTRHYPVMYWRHFNTDNKEIVDSAYTNVDRSLWIDEEPMAKAVLKYVIDCPMRHHEGTISCSAGDAADPITVHAKIVVRKSGLSTVACKKNLPPVITQTTTVLMNPVGDSVTLPCQAVNSSEATTYWFRNDVFVANDNPHHVYTKSGNLLIPKLSWSDMGTWKCIVKSPYGKDTAETFLYPYLRAGVKN